MIHCYEFYASPVISKPRYFELFSHFPWDFEIAEFDSTSKRLLRRLSSYLPCVAGGEYEVWDEWRWQDGRLEPSRGSHKFTKLSFCGAQLANKMLAHGFLLYWCIFFLVLQSRIASSYQVKCSKLLNIFARAVSNYTYCAVSNSRPFRFCCHCKDLYVEALNGHDMIVQDKNCSRELIFSEKHQLLEYAYHFTVDIWKKSNCPGNNNLHLFTWWSNLRCVD